MNAILTFVLSVVLPWLLRRSAETVLDKLLDELFSEENLSGLTQFLKLQLLVLYLDWLLQKSPVKKLPEQRKSHKVLVKLSRS
ncbi:hypothetical protein [Leptolyngbya sp. FACHB-261]|uniref:hypothetical protein n=1 Tax=Leptolyngbya sp. FACHB-261 TaxID=2692806 RepID=UPI0016866483|nr:hypothetical protein [Leptolyngbya sp. FACHB-261]MBD2104723.1 hypothetical protein [Leptolyngbya sp. FACHB-261]